MLIPNSTLFTFLICKESKSWKVVTQCKAHHSCHIRTLLHIRQTPITITTIIIIVCGVWWYCCVCPVQTNYRHIDITSSCRTSGPVGFPPLVKHVDKCLYREVGVKGSRSNFGFLGCERLIVVKKCTQNYIMYTRSYLGRVVFRWLFCLVTDKTDRYCTG